MKKKILFILIFLISVSFSIAFSDYVITNLVINGADDVINIEQQEDTNNYKKVTFLDANDDVIGKRYFKTNDYLYFEDLPKEFQSVKYEWVDSNGNTLFSLANGSFSNGVQIKDEITLKSQSIDLSETTKPNADNFKVNESESKGDSTVSTSDGRVAINEGNTTGSVREMSEPILNNVDLDLNFKTFDRNGKTSV